MRTTVTSQSRKHYILLGLPLFTVWNYSHYPRLLNLFYGLLRIFAPRFHVAQIVLELTYPAQIGLEPEISKPRTSQTLGS